MTPEGKVKEMVKKLLREMGAYYHMPVMNGMGKPTLDFICCYKGMFFAIEAKAPGKLTTAIQANTMREIEEYGGKAFMVDGEESLNHVRNWMLLEAPRQLQ